MAFTKNSKATNWSKLIPFIIHNKSIYKNGLVMDYQWNN